MDGRNFFPAQGLGAGVIPWSDQWAPGSPGGTSQLLSTLYLRLLCVEILGQESGCFLGLVMGAAWGLPARICASLPGGHWLGRGKVE